MSSEEQKSRPLRAAFSRLALWFDEPIDARVYALVRIAYGLACLAIIFELWPYRAELFTEGGLVPRVQPVFWYLPLAYASTLAEVSAVFVLAIVAAVALVAGLLSRLMTIYLWSFTFSYCMAALPAESGYDGVLRCVGFLLTLAPASRALSLDARIFGRGDAEVPRYALRLMQVQFCVIYIATVWYKAPDPFWRNGELMAYFFMSMFSRFPSPEWAHWGRLSAVLTWSSLAIEASLPLLVWTPLRRVALVMGLAFHLSIALTSKIEFFSITMVPLYLSFLTGRDIDDLARLFSRFSARAEAPATTQLPM